MKRLTVVASTLLLSLVFTPARSAERPSLLYATAGAGSNLVAFSLVAKTTRIIGSMGFPPSLSLAFCPPGKIPYTITNLFTTPSTAQLATLNLGRGAATLVGSGPPPDLPNDIMGMTCSRGGTLYAIGQSDPNNPDYNSVFVIDRGSGLPTRIGSLDVNDGTGDDFLMSLAFAPNGELWAANVFTLFRIDPETGLATRVVDFSSNVAGNVMGLAIDSDGNFYVADFVQASRIYALNITTGVATPILNTGLAFVHNIAFRTPG